MSQLEAQSKQIEGRTFKVAKLPPLDAQDIMIDIGQALAPALGKAAAGAAQAFGGSGADSLLDVDVEDPRISSGIAALVQGISKAKMRELVNTMASVSWVDGMPLPQQMPIVFRGNLPLMYQWLWFALGVNFGNFIEWGRSAIGGVLASNPVARSPTTSGDIGPR